jgi:hypothetical protein
MEQKRKRGGRKDRPSQQQKRPSVLERFHRSRTATAAIGELAPYYECTFTGETVEEHIVPRRSRTEQLHLGINRPAMEVEPLRGRQLDKTTGKMVETTDNRLVWKGDRTLLNTSKPESQIGTFKRETVIRKGLNTQRIMQVIKEENITAEVPANAVVDVDMGE